MNVPSNLLGVASVPVLQRVGRGDMEGNEANRASGRTKAQEICLAEAGLDLVDVGRGSFFLFKQ